MGEGWIGLHHQLRAVLRGLVPGRFAVVEVAVGRALDPLLYAQAAREHAGWYCEVVSGCYLTADVWPLDEVALRRSGWSPPDEDPGNWWRAADSVEEVVALLIAALRWGRACDCPELFRWWTGTFPSGPDGGLPVPGADRGPMSAAWAA